MKDIIIKVVRVEESSKVIMHLRVNKRKLDNFFGVELPLPLLVVLQTRRQMNAIWGRKLEPWSVAWAWRGVCIFAVALDRYLKENSKRRDDYYWQILCHEQAHLYLHCVTKGQLPRWLNEGIPTYLAGQHHRQPILEEALLVLKQTNIAPELVYAVGRYWVEILVKKYGAQKFLAFIKALPPQYIPYKFATVFRKTFGVTWSVATLRKFYSFKQRQ